MSNKVKDIDIKNRTYSFFDDIINIKSFDPNKIKIDSYLLHWICHNEKFKICKNK